MTPLLELAQNVMLILALIFVYSLVKPRLATLGPKTQPVIQGVIFAIFALVAMSLPIFIAPGFMFDSHSVVLAIATLFGGSVPGLITAASIGVYRLAMGGIGAPLALGSALTTLAIMLLLRYALARQHLDLNARPLLVAGFLVAATSLFWLSLAGEPLRQQLLGALAVPVFVLYPTGVLLGGLLLQYMDRQADLADAIRASDRRYRSVIAAMTEGVVVRYVDPPHTVLNDAARHMFGPTVDSMKDQQSLPPDWQLINEDGTPRSLDKIPTLIALNTRQPLFGEVFGLVRPDGSTIWLMSNAQPIFNEDGSTPYAAVSITTDITQERLTRQQLAQERNQLRTLIDNIPDYIFIKDVEGRYVISNKAHARSAHSTPEEIVGKTTQEVYPADVAGGFEEHDRKVIETGQAVLNVEQPSIGQDGSLVTVLTNKIPLWDENGKCIGLIGITRDITDRANVAKQAQQLDAERQRSELMRQFMNDVTHDFKTPLTILNTSIYLLQKTDDPVRKQEQIDKLETQITRLTHLFDDFVTITNLDDDAYAHDMQPQDVNGLVASVVENNLPLAHQKLHTLTFTPDADVPAIDGNSIMLRRAIANILINALHYTPDGGLISVRTFGDDDCVVIETQDNGIGIGPDDLPHIFERLYRADRARSTTTGGTGLGLTIAQKIVETHGGTIRVVSTPDQGSTFQIRLPRNPAQAAAD